MQRTCTLWRRRVHLRTGFYNPFVRHDSGISPQIFQLYSLITQKIRNVNKVPFFHSHIYMYAYFSYPQPSLLKKYDEEIEGVKKANFELGLFSYM